MDLRRLAQNARSARRARRRMELTGLTPNGYPLWNGIERGNLIEGYPDYRSVMTLNPRRTRPAHYGKAGREKITKPRSPEWSPEEISAVRHGYSHLSRDQLQARLPLRSWGAICRRGRSMGLARPRPAFAPSGYPVLDQMLVRAHAKGWTLRTLDEFAQRIGYFEKRKWRHDSGRMNVFGRTVHEMGGAIKARWPAV